MKAAFVTDLKKVEVKDIPVPEINEDQGFNQNTYCRRLRLRSGICSQVHTLSVKHQQS